MSEPVLSAGSASQEPPKATTSKPAHVIIVGNEKGGSGKTTTTMHLIVALLRLGFTVGSMDIDARQRSLGPHGLRVVRAELRFQVYARFLEQRGSSGTLSYKSWSEPVTVSDGQPFDFSGAVNALTPEETISVPGVENRVFLKVNSSSVSFDTSEMAYSLGNLALDGNASALQHSPPTGHRVLPGLFGLTLTGLLRDARGAGKHAFRSHIDRHHLDALVRQPVFAQLLGVVHATCLQQGEHPVAFPGGRDQAGRRALAEEGGVGHHPGLVGEGLLPGQDQRQGDPHGRRDGDARHGLRRAAPDDRMEAGPDDAGAQQAAESRMVKDRSMARRLRSGSRWAGPLKVIRARTIASFQ